MEAGCQGLGVSQLPQVGLAGGQTLPVGTGGGADPTRDPLIELCLFSSLKVLKTPLLSLLQCTMGLSLGYVGELTASGVPGAASLGPTPPLPHWEPMESGEGVTEPEGGCEKSSSLPKPRGMPAGEFAVQLGWFLLRKPA